MQNSQEDLKTCCPNVCIIHILLQVFLHNFSNIWLSPILKTYSQDFSLPWTSFCIINLKKKLFSVPNRQAVSLYIFFHEQIGKCKYVCITHITLTVQLFIVCVMHIYVKYAMREKGLFLHEDKFKPTHFLPD